MRPLNQEIAAKDGLRKICASRRIRHWSFMQRLGTVENAMGNQSTPSARVKTLLRSPCRNSASWDGDQLAGLARVIDDGEMLAYMHWVLVNPKYQGMHVGSGLVERVKERYAGYMFLEVMPEESKTLRSTSATASRSWKTAARCRS